MNVGSQQEEYDSIIYVDGLNGSDSNNGSLSHPVKTSTQAVSLLPSVGTNCVYFITEGTYAVPNGIQSLLKAEAQVTYASSPEAFGKVTLEFQSTSTNSAIKMNQLNRFIGLVLKRTTAGDSRAYEYFYDGSKINLEFYNCVFLAGGILTAPYVPIFTGNSGGASVTKMGYINCTFEPLFSHTDNGATAKGDYLNCAIVNKTLTSKPSNLHSVILDSMWNITSNGWKNSGIGTNPDGSVANIGVYGGKYSWHTIIPIQITPKITNASIPKNTDYLFQFKIEPAKYYRDIMLSSQMVKNSTLGTGTLFSQVLDRNKWNLITGLKIN